MKRRWLDKTWWFLTSWYAPAAGCLLALLVFLIWAWPTRSDWYVAADGRKWPAGDGAPRQVLWEPAQALAGLLPDDGTGSLLTPRLADGGASLYFAYRAAGGQAKLYVSRFVDGAWQQATPLTALNSEADQIGPVLSGDGRQLYFYSNRPGGLGGFDLYVSRKTAAGWSAPANLGPTVNSSAHEYDPALAEDGLSLYFASNRTAGMQGDPKKLGVTVRAHPGLTQFDLYVARRPGAEEAWSAPEPVAELNDPRHNEGAPFLSRGFLYFASDRPVRPGEPANLDLYRARLVEGRWADVENLGPDINTPAHETEPGLSPEGFRLVFSSDRDGQNRLYVSSAQEVYARTDWDTHRLSAVAAHWWQILLLALMTAALFAVVYLAHGWLVEKATAARFFLASLLIHCLLVLLLGIMQVGREIYEQSTSTEVGDIALASRVDDSPPSDQVADLHTLEQPVNQPVQRQITEAPNIPTSSEPQRPANLPAIRVEVPPERLVLEPPPPERAPRPDRPTRRPTRISAPAQVAVRDVTLDQPERPMENAQPAQPAPSVARQDPVVPMPAEPRSGPARPQPVKVEVGKITTNPMATVPTPQAEQPALERRTRPTQVATARISPSPDVKVPTAPKGDSNTPASPSRVDVARATTTVTPADNPKPTERPTTVAGPARPPVDLNRPAVASATPVPRAEADNPFRRPTRRIEAREPVAVNKGAVPAPVAPATLPGDTPLTGLNTPSPARRDTLPEFPVTTSESPGGPNRPAEPRFLRGALGKANIDVPPSFGPSATSLPRRAPRNSSAASMPAFFSPRENRTASVEKFGGTKESEAAVERGLDWLALHQDRDGSWSLQEFHKNCKHAKCNGAGKVRADAGATGLALLPFLAARYTHREGKHRQTVQRGLDWLVQHQERNGLLESGSYRPFYGHGIAALALCEAYAMTRDPRLREPAQKALDYIVANQHSTGGWRYTPGQSSDTSVTGWQVMALRSGELAGLNVPRQPFQGVQRWLKSVESNKPTGGLFGYQDASPTPAMTAQGLLCLQMLGARRGDPRMSAGADYLLKHLPQPGSDTSYYWYHATQVMFHMQGKHWQAWNSRFRDMLVNDQVKQGPLSGTWTPRDAREQTGGRLYATALRLLMLEVYYSHLPIYQQLEGDTTKK